MTRLPILPLLRTLKPTRPSVPRKTLPCTYKPVHQPRFYPGSSYGGGEGDPKGEDPQNQGSNPSADLEHPGPPPPDVGKGTGGGPTKKGGDGHNTGQNASSGGGEGGGSSGGEGKGGPQPKIYKSDAPGEEHHSEDVKQHNEEMAQRHDRPQEKSPDEEDKVDKKFWKGQGGADRNP